MKNINGLNVGQPQQFGNKLQVILDGINDLMELTKESEVMPVSEDGVIQYIEESGKCFFETARQYDRPNEFLQCLLDMMRAIYEPSLLGTFFLNSNPCFLFEEMPDHPFQLAYASLISDDNQPFNHFYTETVMPYLTHCGYDITKSSAIFSVATTGDDRYDPDFVTNVSKSLGSGFTVDEALGLIAETISPDNEKPQKQSYSGFCVDPALGNRVRLSLWLFIRNKPAT